MAKIEDEENEEGEEVHGHITSLSVLRSHRRLGIA
jgi:N-alpha-acetyltransferase 10/11